MIEKQTVLPNVFDDQKLAEVSVSSMVLTDGEDVDIPTSTRLFRADTQLREVLGMALRGRGEQEADNPLVVLSVGSSFGAEADSVLAYLERSAIDLGRVSLLGIDVNPLAVAQAKTGRYFANTPWARTNEGKLEKVDLPSYLTMFEVTPNPDATADHSQFIVDSNQLRGRHDIAFVEGDLTKEDLEIPDADVILCNNVLFHLSPEGAEKLVTAMAGHLKVGGIMSFGANPRQVTMNSNSMTSIDYPQWRRDMAAKLAAEGVEPIYEDTDRQAPFVFRRVA